MRIINKSNSNRYCTVAHRALAPGQRTADSDMGGLKKAMDAVVKSCGSGCCLVMNPDEERLITKIIELHKEGTDFKFEGKKESYFNKLLAAEDKEKREKMASIEAMRAREKAVRDETTYANRRDIDEAHAKASSIKGEVQAKKLDMDVTGTVSISDLMGDNKFIEESMKHSHVPTAVSNEDGWDMNKMNAPKVDEILSDPEIKSNAEDAVEDTENSEPVKRRRSRKQNKSRPEEA